jgi:hypothetical protein
MTTASQHWRRAARVRLPPTESIGGQVALAGSLGLTLVCIGFALARANEHLVLGELLSWAGIGLVVATACAALLADERPRSERVLIVVAATVLLYGVKVLHDPTRFTLGDEYVHVANTRFILGSGTLFTANPILPVTASYPGLEIVTSAVAAVTHLSIFASGLIVIGLARVLLALGLFLVFEALTGSPRVAGIAVLLYAANPNYMYWSAQYSYESLSLPILVVILALVLTSERSPPDRRRRWMIAAALLGAAVVITHHLTAYILAASLWALVGLCSTRTWRRFTPPLALAVVVTATTLAWLTVVAVNTRGYLENVFSRAFAGFADAVASSGGRRVPFQSLSGVTTPVWDRALAGGALLITTAGVGAGLMLMRRRWRSHPLLALLVLAAPGYLFFLGLRVVPGAWEVGSRSSEFLFIGVALLLGLSAAALADWARDRGYVRAALVAASVVLVIGGSVIGWPQSVRLPRPFTVAAAGGAIEPQGAAVADWGTLAIQPTSGITADDSNGRLLIAAGFPHLLVGREPGAHDLFEQPRLPDWVRTLLTRRHMAYVVFDRRISSTDVIAGQFFPRPGEKRQQYPRVAVEKLRRLGLPVVFSSGDIRIYDIRSITGAREGGPR